MRGNKIADGLQNAFKHLLIGQQMALPVKLPAAKPEFEPWEPHRELTRKRCHLASIPYVYSFVETSLLLTAYPFLDSKKKLSINGVAPVVARHPLGKICLISSTDKILSRNTVSTMESSGLIISANTG